MATAVTLTNESINNKVVPALERLSERFDDLRSYVGERFADVELSLRGIDTRIKGLELVDAALGKEIRATENSIIGAIGARLRGLEGVDTELGNRMTAIEKQLEGFERVKRKGRAT